MTIAAKLEQARRNLLELSTRNRLISMPRRRKRAKVVEIIDERADDVFRILVTDSREMTFLPAPDGLQIQDDGGNLLDQPISQDPNRHTDKYLQTTFESKALQKRLLTIYYDARTSIEETGINILYLALGALKWYEADTATEERYAPLLLLPVELTRESAEERFKLRWAGEEITSNLSMLEKMRLDFGLELPAVPDTDDLVPSSYFSEVRQRCAGMDRWDVQSDEMMLGFFSFAKLLMYHDLDPKSWPSPESLTDQPLISSLLMDGFANEESSVCGEEKIDECVSVETAIHVVDADSSQTAAIEEVKAGRSLVIQGPPGTGKSQTIANLIAAAVAQGRKVLFVAEKLAALEVVKRRLDAIDLGNVCLELHSRKANKKAVLQELRQTLQLAPPRVASGESLFEKLRNVRGSLNEFCETMHKVQEPSGTTAYRILGELTRLYGRDSAFPDFKLADAARWTRDQHQNHRAVVAELVARAAPVFPPMRHLWRGVGMDVLMPADKQRVLKAIKETTDTIQTLKGRVKDLGVLLGRPASDTITEAHQLSALGGHFATAPAFDRNAATDSLWVENRLAIENAVAIGERYTAIVADLQAKVTENAWFEDARSIRDTLSRHGGSLKRFFSKEYRQAIRQLRALLRIPAPKTLSDQLSLLDALIEYQEQWHALAGVTEVGRAAFGAVWNDHQSDWPTLRNIVAWTSELARLVLAEEFLAGLPVATKPSDVLVATTALKNALEPCRTAVQDLGTSVQLDSTEAFEARELDDVSITTATARFEAWADAFEALPEWISFRQQAKRSRQTGLSDVCDQLYQGHISPGTAVDLFDKARFEAVLSAIIANHTVLQTFSGAAHDRKVAEFRSLDLARIEFARYEVALAHYEQIPRVSTTSGGLGVVQREMQKKRSHLPIRKLMEKAGAAIQSIKPVFMMSPLSVAQFLPPATVQFDLILIDEASQVEPVDALGAVSRGGQVVVVGDDRQLPPSRFFSRMQDDDVAAEDSDDHFQVTDVESILGLCLAQGMRQTMLRWHYRSRHHSLIRVSNEQFYENKLLIVPSAFAETSTSGVKCRAVPDGVFDRGASRTNVIEARAVARAVIEHARQYPHLTLGVGAFSLSQKDAILAELELGRRGAGSDAEGFFNAHEHEPFFVKNLENIQGDERDVIFISVGYGKDSSGYMAMSFGPLSADGGERRLNVLITRARIRCEVFSSITSDDIDLERGRSKGVAAFKSYLQFAQTGNVSLGTSNVKDFDSPFEEEVYRSLKQLGFDVVGQVGIAGFFVDLAILDPKKPGRFVIGIECDGTAYHSCRSARDRDRLRQQVLEDQGWFIHRIWSTDWFRAPEESLRKTVAAIEAARARWSERDHDLFGASDRSNKPPEAKIARDESDSTATVVADTIAVPYREAFVSVETYIEPHLTPPHKMSAVVEQIVAQEGPVHRDEIARRVTSIWGLQRTGSRIATAVNSALNRSVRSQRLTVIDEFADITNRAVRAVRSRAETALPLRRPEMLPPTEIQFGFAKIIEIHHGITEGEAIHELARAFGFAATSPQLRERFVVTLRDMISAGDFRLDGDTILAH